jgi:hypothetical protein
VGKRHPDQSSKCPLAAVDQRLADAHRLWHQAEAAYFDPDGFRLEVQTAITTLRSVTFILQNQKAIIPDFAQWYGRWQERLGTDALMRWMKDTRNKIEKQGDLEAKSFVRAEIVASYLDVGPWIEIPAKLFQSPRVLLDTIPHGAVGEHIWRHGVLRLQRRWVENTLPDYELLDAIAIAFGKITELIHDAHRQIGLDPPETIHDDTGEGYDRRAMGWRFPCMIAHELSRTADFSLADGSRIEFDVKRTTKKVTRAEAEEFLRKRGVDLAIKKAMGQEYKTYSDLAAGYFDMFKAVFLKAGYHVSILFLFRDMKPIKQMQIIVENTQQKYLLMRQLASEVINTGADAAMVVGESWMAPAESLGPYERPAESPRRIEALSASLVRKTGDPIDCMAVIHRNGDVASLGETDISTFGAQFEFAPFYEAWGRPIPPSWVDISKAIVARAKGG